MGYIARSSNGRTTDFESVSGGSIPPRASQELKLMAIVKNFGLIAQRNL